MADKDTLVKEDAPFRAGDTVRVHAKIKEGNRERIQLFEGVVLQLKGRGDNQTFTVRRNGASGVGIERIWPLNSHNIEKIDVVKRGHYRRSKVFFVRELSARQLAAASASRRV